MRSTINLDDTLMERARSLTGTKETAAIVRQALETLVRAEFGNASSRSAELCPMQRQLHVAGAQLPSDTGRHFYMDRSFPPC